MKIAYDWLRTYIDLPETPDILGSLLTSTGLEVESIENYESIRGGLHHVVIGEVVSCIRHPQADRLSLTKVEVGSGRMLPIVCGAPNVATGQKVVVALPGASLYPSGGEPLTIKKTKIRGEVSEGMICAEDELGVGTNHAGIMVLDTQLPNGTPATHYFSIHRDSIFEIGLTPNRADAASHVGVARDIRAATGRPIRWPAVEGFQPGPQKGVQIEIENTTDCIRYAGVTLAHVKVGESPAWLKNRLASIGIAPINNVVDITNFVLHETGQPLHAFDRQKIAGDTIRVKNLQTGTPFVTLDGKIRHLRAADLMICDGNHEPLCIAGVLGGLESGISAHTVEVFLESACFAPPAVRNTAQHHQLKTDASFRFERGTDPAMPVYALQRAALLMCEIAGARIISPITDHYPRPVSHRVFPVKVKNIHRLIGEPIPVATMQEILDRLDIKVRVISPDLLEVEVPPYRVDVMQEADIAEEVLRIYGFNNIPLRSAAGTPFLSSFPERDIDKWKRALGELLTGQGFLEIVTNSLTSADYAVKTGLSFTEEPVEILNKLSEEQGILRQTMLFTGLEACAHNINRQQKDLKFFEIGKVYGRANGKYTEREVLALYLTGHAQAESWQQPARMVTYYDLAQAVQNALSKCAALPVQEVMLQDATFEYGVSLQHEGREVARMGKVAGRMSRLLGIKSDVFYAELPVDLLFRLSNPKFEVAEVPRFPEVRRDLSLVLDKQVTFAEVEALARKTESRYMKRISLFDVYEGDRIDAHKKAYALGFTLQAEDKTLTDAEIEQAMNKLMTAFEQQLGAVIRK